MDQPRHRTRNVVATTLGSVALAALLVTGLIIGTTGADDGSAVRTRTGAMTHSPGTTAVLAVDRLAELEASGEVRTMMDLHQGMLDQMRVSASPAMLELMDNDPMWQMLHSGDYVRLLEEHEENIDRMLARDQ